jgi:hypothetical protein
MDVPALDRKRIEAGIGQHICRVGVMFCVGGIVGAVVGVGVVVGENVAVPHPGDRAPSMSEQSGIGVVVGSGVRGTVAPVAVGVHAVSRIT